MNGINSKLRAEEVSRPFGYSNKQYFCFEWSLQLNISNSFKSTCILEFWFFFTLCDVQLIFPCFSTINSGVPHSSIVIFNCKFLNFTFQLWESRAFTKWLFVKSTKIYRFNKITITFEIESNALISSLIEAWIWNRYFGDCWAPSSCYSTCYTWICWLFIFSKRVNVKVFPVCCKLCFISTG